MKRIFLLLFLTTGINMLPVFIFGQSVPYKTVQKSAKPKILKPISGEFVINAIVTGYSEGVSVELLNGQTGATEQTAILKGNKFEFKGQMEKPDFKIIIFNRKPPYITLFLDNSNVNITGDIANIEKSTIIGSSSHSAFEQFNTSLEPYQSVFVEGSEYDSSKFANARKLIQKFVLAHTDSYITPLAIIRFNQIADNIINTEELFNMLNPDVKASAMGQYIAKQIEESKLNITGTELANFSQADVNGKLVSLSSFRGKYVLVDFWASWCGPCRQENPNLLAAFNKYKNKNFTVFGVSLDQNKQKWIDAIEMDSLTWTNVSDLQGWQNAVAQQFKIFSIPQNFLIDPYGKVIGKNLRGAALERKLAQVLR